MATSSSLSPPSLGGVTNQLLTSPAFVVFLPFIKPVPRFQVPAPARSREQQAGLLSQAAPSPAAFGGSGECRDLRFKSFLSTGV